MKIYRSKNGTVLIENYKFLEEGWNNRERMNAVCISSADYKMIFALSSGWTIDRFEKVDKIRILFDENQSVYSSKDGSQIIMINNYRNVACLLTKDCIIPMKRDMARKIVKKDNFFKIKDLTVKSSE